jgi:hypothetical protein
VALFEASQAIKPVEHNHQHMVCLKQGSMDFRKESGSSFDELGLPLALTLEAAEKVKQRYKE